MSDPAEDRILQEYLHRKSALSMGYKRVYVEEPPPELDRAVTARARRALRWLLPGLLATFIGLGLLFGTSFGVTKLVGMMVSAEKNVHRLEKERKERDEKERSEAPVSVIIDPGALSTGRTRAPQGQLTREEWLAKIERLKKTGTAAEVESEVRRFNAVYPENASPVSK